MIEVLISLTLVALAIGVSVAYQFGVEKELLVATIRAIVQLAVIASLIHLVLGELGWSAPLLIVMLLVAAFTAARRMKDISGAFILALVAIGTASGVALLVLFGLGAFPLEPRYLIPLGGMVIGNAMNAVSIAGTRLGDEVFDKSLEVEARLALGVGGTEALRPYVRRSAVTGLIPTLDSTKNVGLVFLPGAFVGMILADASPRDAAEVQLVVLFMLLGAVSIAGLVATLLIARTLITPDERLIVPTR
jgi:putative ABC transport system permease protein